MLIVSNKRIHFFNSALGCFDNVAMTEVISDASQLCYGVRMYYYHHIRKEHDNQNLVWVFQRLSPSSLFVLFVVKLTDYG